jgi:GNAT superfamily N-acetyltransferase
MGTARFSRVQYNGQMLPLAFLDNLKVRDEFSGQGLGYQIADWSIQQAREALGEECIIATSMLQDNHASRGVAKKWCREFIGPMNTFILPVRLQAPKSLHGITVREIKTHEHFAIWEKALPAICRCGHLWELIGRRANMVSWNLKM